MFQAVEERDRQALWFENVAGHDIPVVIGALAPLPMFTREFLVLNQMG